MLNEKNGGVIFVYLNHICYMYVKVAAYISPDNMADNAPLQEPETNTNAGSETSF